MYVLANPNYVDTALPVSVLGLICPTLSFHASLTLTFLIVYASAQCFPSSHGCFLYWIHARFRCFLRLGLQKRPPRVRIKLHVPVNSLFLVLCVTSNVCPSAVVLVLQLFVLVVLSVVFPYFFLVLVALCCFPCCFLSALNSHSTQSPLLVQLRQQAPPCALLDTSQLYL